MRIRRVLAFLALLLSVPALAGIAPQHASTTSLTMTLYLVGGRQPMADVPVTIYYSPFNPPAKYKLQVMATTTTNDAGRFAAVINTAMVANIGLGDVGTGPDAFNSEVVAVAPSRQIVDSPQILQLGHAVTATAVAIASPDTGKPEL